MAEMEPEDRDSVGSEKIEPGENKQNLQYDDNECLLHRWGLKNDDTSRAILMKYFCSAGGLNAEMGEGLQEIQDRTGLKRWQVIFGILGEFLLSSLTFSER